MTTPYNLSTDYAELYRLIQNGQTLVGFVEKKPELVSIVKFYDGSILIGIKPDGHAFLMPDNPIFPEEDPKEAFFKEFFATCKSLNLKFIKPD